MEVSSEGFSDNNGSGNIHHRRRQAVSEEQDSPRGIKQSTTTTNNNIDDENSHLHGHDLHSRCCPPTYRTGLLLTLVLLALYHVGMNRQLEDKIWSSRPEVEERPEGEQRSYPQGNGWQDFQRDYYLRYHRRPPDSLRMWLQYAKDNKCNDRDFYTYIEEDLKSYREQINRTGSPLRYPDVISSGQRLTDNYIAFTLENHQLNVVASHNIHLNFVQQSMIERNIRKLLLPLLAHQPPFQSVLFFDLHDHPSRGTTSDTLPLFSVCKMRYMTEDKRPPSDAQLATFMDQSFTPSVLGQRHQYTRLQADASIFHPEFTDSYDSRGIMVPYHFGLNDDEEASPNPSMPALKDRKDAIVWRGSTTGSEWGVSPRFHLVERFGGNDAHPIALSVPVIADFAFVDIVQNYTDKHTMSPHWRVSRRMEPEEAQLFKYIMDVDGNSFTARFPRLLRLGSVLFKSTRYREWFSERLRPFVDYVPVNYNLTDLVDKVKWVHEHPEMAERIAQHGKEMSTHHIRDDDMRCYIYRLILEYHTLFSGDW